MSAIGNRFRLTRGKSSTRRSMLIACGAACSAFSLSFIASTVQAQTSATWTSATSGNWSNGAKWMGGSAPAVDPNGDVNLEFNGPGTYTANNDLGSFGVFNVTFDAGNGTTNLTGGGIGLASPTSEPNNPTFANNSTNPVTINNNAEFIATTAQGDSTLEQFVLAPGSTTTFNGSMTLDGGAGLTMTNGQTSGTGGPGGTMIWTQPVIFTNTQINNSAYLGNYFPFRIYEGTFEMGGYTINNGTSNNPIINVSGVNVLQSTGADGNITAGPNAGMTGTQRF